ncbi:MAG: hypothetical protein ACRBBO_05920 [Cognatishimia sp.]
MMENVYSNFDGLDLSFHGVVPEGILDALEQAKGAAVEAREPVPTDLGGVTVMVRETGRRGGYKFVFDTGEDGEIWAMMGSNEPNGRWMMHCSVRSAAFVQYGGLSAIKERLSERLKAFGFEATRCPKSGRFESVSRVDFAMDFHMNDFVLEPEKFSTKAGTQSHFEGVSANWAGRICTGVTLGKMPNRQVCVYDKSREIQVTRKSYWWQVWGIDPEECEEKPKIWRIELRAGKRFLSEAWKLHTLEDIEDAIGDLMADTLRKVRYVDLVDTNVTRCPDAPLWERAALVIQNGLWDHFSGLVPNAIKETVREQFEMTMTQMLRGVALTYAAVKSGSRNLTEIKRQIEAAAEDVLRSIDIDHDDCKRAVARAQDRYRFLEVEAWQKKRKQPCPEWLSA